MSKAEFLERMRTARVALDEAVSGLTEDQIAYDIVAGEWTVKDILAHLGAWENEAALMIERAANGLDDGPAIAESVDEWNARRVSERRRLPLVDVMQEFNEARDRLMRALVAWPEEQAPLGPDGWDESARLWWLTEHDQEHLDAIQIYRARLAKTQPA